MTEIQKEQQDTPDFLKCEPRTYKVKLNHWHEDTCDLEFTLVIKCIDDVLHDINDFWSNHESRLEDNDGDIVAVILKMIGRKVFWWCYEHNSNSVHKDYGVNSIFKDEGWSLICFEITKLNFDNYVDDDAFEFAPLHEENSNA